jgi:hypothetical protein
MTDRPRTPSQQMVACVAGVLEWKTFQGDPQGATSSGTSTHLTPSTSTPFRARMPQHRFRSIIYTHLYSSAVFRPSLRILLAESRH